MRMEWPWTNNIVTFNEKLVVFLENWLKPIQLAYLRWDNVYFVPLTLHYNSFVSIVPGAELWLYPTSNILYQCIIAAPFLVSRQHLDSSLPGIFLSYSVSLETIYILWPETCIFQARSLSQTLPPAAFTLLHFFTAVAVEGPLQYFHTGVEYVISMSSEIKVQMENVVWG